jgi:hypothetical protein
MTITASSNHLDEEIHAARLLHPLAKAHLQMIKESIDRRAAGSGANLYFCARDTLAAMAPNATSTARSQAASSAIPLLSLHVQAKGYRTFTNGVGVVVWARPI